MTSRFILSAFLLALIFSCSSPQQNDNLPDPEINSKWADDNLREIHDLKNGRHTEGLIRFLEDSEPHFRAEAAMALGSVQDTAAQLALGETLNDQAPEVRMMGAFALGQLKTQYAATALIELVERDTTTAVRTETLEAIGKTGQPEAAEFLANYLPNYFYDESGHAWGMYQLALHGAAEKRHTQIMTALLASEYEETRLAAAHYFARFEIDEVAAGMDRLLNLASKDPSSEVRMAATAALGKIDLPDRVEVLEALVVYDEHPGVRVHAIRSLTNIKADSKVFEEAMFDGNPNVALAAAEFFSENPGLAGNARLRQQAVAHPVRSVRGALYATLLQRGESSEELLDEMFRLINEGETAEIVPLIAALQYAPSASGMLDSLSFSEQPAVRSTALGALLAQYESAPAACGEWNQLMTRIVESGDYGQLAMLGNHLRNGSAEARKCWDGSVSIDNVMNNLNLPEGLEAWLEWNYLRTEIDGKTAEPMPDLPYHEINWSRLQSAGPQPTVIVRTNKGSFSMVLLSEDAPATVSYFLEKMDQGYFAGKSFHRVVPNFVVQTGCPRGDGYGGGETLLRSEFSPLHYGPGVVGMASAGKDTESTQWFVTHRTTPHLDGRYTIFAAVIEGMDVIWQLEQGDVIEAVEMVNRVQ